MIKRLRHIWNSPTVKQTDSPWKAGLYYGIAVYALLALLKPFGIDSLMWMMYVYLLGYFFITLLGVVLPFYILKWIDRDFFSENCWTHGHSVIVMFITIFLITFGNALYFTLYGFEWNLQLLWMAFWQTMVVTLCVSGVKLWQVNRTLQQNLERVVELNRHINQQSEMMQETLVTVEGVGKNATLRLTLESLLYVESEKNYCRFVCWVDGQLKESLLRITISSVEELFKSYIFIIKSHRAFLVNLQNIREVEGNSAGYRLLTKYVDREIPVSRSYTSIVLDRIENLL